MIISTGMANLDEIGEAVETARANGCDDLVLLHCVSSYPAPDEQSNLRTIPDLGKRFGLLTGLSDHTHASAVAVASIALGACVIEKHFTLAPQRRRARRRLQPGARRVHRPGDRLQAGLASARARSITTFRAANGGSVMFRRSLYVVEDIAAGEELTRRDMCARSGPATAWRPSGCRRSSAPAQLATSAAWDSR